MEEEERKIYLCDPKKNVNCSKGKCYKNGGGCCFTAHAEFQKDIKSYLNNLEQDLANSCKHICENCPLKNGDKCLKEMIVEILRE